ncbi:MAG: class I SAM-dependent methyltransferase [Verrucomicrobia bacterium]|nr:class I SAM-dependent methyltransferase [Verrucomicrobiota bacterium]MCH8512767.1 class I SAM-dependent methyltransferase [Kiritimatiellia bacterium]
MKPDGYELLDSGEGRKLERFGDRILERPASQAVWKPDQPESHWDRADARFDRLEGNRWHGRHRLPDEWEAEIEGITFRLSSTDFGHLGVFPEQRPMWKWMRETCKTRKNPTVLNLFAYSGGATLAPAQGGATVCHVDASRGMTDWARENARRNRLSDAPIRWIVDDVPVFLGREIRRGRQYDGIILDPPSFGRGAKGEMFKIEERINPLLEQVRALLSAKPLFVLLSCHTPGFSAQVLKNLLEQHLQGLGGEVDCGEMLLTGGRGVRPLPSGNYARWIADQ